MLENATVFKDLKVLGVCDLHRVAQDKTRYITILEEIDVYMI